MDRISLYYNGRRLTDTTNLPNNVTLQGSVNAYTVDTHDGLDAEESHELENPYVLVRVKPRKRSLLLGAFPPRGLREMRYNYAQLHIVFRLVLRLLGSSARGK